MVAESVEKDINLSKKGLLTHFLVQKSCSNIQSDFECFCNLFAINMSNTSRKKYCLKPDKLYTANGCGSMGIFKTLLKSGLREARVHNCTIHTRYHSRFFVQVGHKTTYHHFFTIPCHRQTYQSQYRDSIDTWFYAQLAQKNLECYLIHTAQWSEMTPQERKGTIIQFAFFRPHFMTNIICDIHLTPAITLNFLTDFLFVGFFLWK